MSTSSSSNRRNFLRTLAGLTAGVMIPYRGFSYTGKTGAISDRIGERLPLRKLGKTGERVTMLGLGGYHIGWTTEEKAQATIEAALEGGVRFFDNAESYSDGLSEERYGKYLVPRYRDDIFLMTKTYSTDPATTRKHLEGSLRRLKTDQLDLWQVHSLQSPADTEKRIDNGVLDVIAEAKKSGKVRYVGFTGHNDPHAHARMLDKTGEDFFDTCQHPINIVDAIVNPSFIDMIIPRLLDRNMGVLAMKTLADGRFFSKKVQQGDVIWDTNKPVVPDHLTIEEALSFAWSLPISVLITGAENPQLIREKVTMARRFEKLTEKERTALIDRVADVSSKGDVEYYKNPG
ncbi:MAG TPA: aldo/keto reductase [Bacteroidales bacterium]|nr:aldo/keto reductase [Bacteroidales bacterium]